MPKAVETLVEDLAAVVVLLLQAFDKAKVALDAYKEAQSAK